MAASMEEAVHLGKDSEEHLRVTRNTDISEIRPLFSITQKLVLDQQHLLLQGTWPFYWKNGCFAPIGSA